MIFRMLFLLLAFMPLTTSLQAGWLDNITSYFQKDKPLSPPKIKVLIVHDQPGVVLEVKGKYKIFDPHTKDHLTTRFVGKRRFIQAMRDGIKWGEEFPGVHQIVIVPDDKFTTTIVDGIEYRGSIYVYDVDGSISVVNETFIEDYLTSTLPLQYRDYMPEEALAAIAIAARTTAYYQSENPKSEFWAADGRQVNYQGVSPNINQSPMGRAITTTRYMVMSNTSARFGEALPFIADWKQPNQQKTAAQAIVSQISLTQVNDLAKQGEHAAQILTKAFPGTKIELIHYLE